jgi:lysophospholipase L1-like esterase
MKKALTTIALLGVVAWILYLQGGSRGSWPVVNEAQAGKTIVAFGDSLTSGYGADAEKSYPKQLEGLIGHPVLNLGKNGETTTSALTRLDEVIAQKPNYVLITLGGNDLRQRTPLDETVTNLETIFTRLQEAGAMVVYLSIHPPLIGDNWIMAIEDVCRRKGVLWVDRIMRELWEDSSRMADSVHPNAEGYGVIAGQVHEALKPYF